MAHRRTGFEVIYVSSIEGFPTNFLESRAYRPNLGKYREIEGELKNIGGM